MAVLSQWAITDVRQRLRGTMMNTKMLKLVLASAAIAIASAAHASNTPMTLNSYPGPDLTPGDTASFLNSPGIGSISDNWTFGLTTSNGVGAQAIDFNFLGIFNIIGFAATLYQSNGAGGYTGPAIATGGSGVTFVVPSLAAGEYDLVITGTANGTAGGFYQGVVSAVPLPAAAWLLLSGLAGVGIMARRRKIEAIPA